jgi:hypothetical protein
MLHDDFQLLGLEVQLDDRAGFGEENAVVLLSFAFLAEMILKANSFEDLLTHKLNLLDHYPLVLNIAISFLHEDEKLVTELLIHDQDLATHNCHELFIWALLHGYDLRRLSSFRLDKSDRELLVFLKTIRFHHNYLVNFGHQERVDFVQFQTQRSFQLFVGNPDFEVMLIRSAINLKRFLVSLVSDAKSDS